MLVKIAAQTSFKDHAVDMAFVPSKVRNREESIASTKRKVKGGGIGGLIGGTLGAAGAGLAAKHMGMSNREALAAAAGGGTLGAASGVAPGVLAGKIYDKHKRLQARGNKRHTEHDFT